MSFDMDTWLFARPLCAIVVQPSGNLRSSIYRLRQTVSLWLERTGEDRSSLSRRQMPRSRQTAPGEAARANARSSTYQRRGRIKVAYAREQQQKFLA